MSIFWCGCAVYEWLAVADAVYEWLAVADAVYEWLAVADAALAGYRVIWAGATFDDEERGQLVIVKRYATIL